MRIMTEDEFEQEFGGNWMRTDNNGNYFRISKEKIIITNCKNVRGYLSNEPFVAIDNTNLKCDMECFATIEEAKKYLNVEEN